jgi:hypothetical protein
MPEGLRAACASSSIDRVDDVEASRTPVQRLHHGAERPGAIASCCRPAEFFADHLVAHEYFHVLRQWNRGRLSIARYLAEWVRHGYWSNRYERQARRFVALRLPALRKHLARNFHTMRDPETP